MARDQHDGDARAPELRASECAGDAQLNDAPRTVESLLASVHALVATARRDPHDASTDFALDAIGVLASALELDRSDRFASLSKVGPDAGACLGCGSPTRLVMVDEARMPAAPLGASREVHCIGCMLKELHSLRAECVAKAEALAEWRAAAVRRMRLLVAADRCVDTLRTCVRDDIVIVEARAALAAYDAACTAQHGDDGSAGATDSAPITGAQRMTASPSSDEPEATTERTDRQ